MTATPLEIAEALAEQSAPVMDGGNGPDYCLLCGSNKVWVTYNGDAPIENHSTDCPWRMAKEWYQATLEGKA